MAKTDAGSRAVMARRRKKDDNEGLTEIISREEAIARDLGWYFSGVPCGRGHIAKRSVSNWQCRDCTEHRRRERRKENPTPFREAEGRRYWSDPDKKRSQARERRAANPEQHREWARQDYGRHKEAIKARVVAWQKKNPGRMNHWVRLRRARIARATPPWLTAKQKREIRAFYIEAAAREGEWHVDHIVPLKGRNVCGLHVPWNLQILTGTENRRKSNSHG